MKTDNKLILENVLWGYGDRSLVASPVSVAINSPAFILLLGANGTGKSTLLKTLGGLLKPIAGRIVFNGESVDKLSKKEGFVAFVFAQRPHVDFMKVRDLVMSGALAHNNIISRFSQEQIQYFEYAVHVTGVKSIQDRYINEISDGEFQKAMIARALMQNTSVIVLDEPTAFLDYNSKSSLFELLSDIARKEHKIIIASTHDPDLAQEKGEIFWLIKNQDLRIIHKVNLDNKKLRDELK